eukprot:scaffold289103_cov35-Tisochrysis_lutea.AAC.3
MAHLTSSLMVVWMRNVSRSLASPNSRSNSDSTAVPAALDVASAPRGPLITTSLEAAAVRSLLAS